MSGAVRTLTAAGFLSFFVFGFADNLRGAILPSLLADLSLTDTQGGTVQLATYLGFIIACFLTGMLADLAGNRLVLIVAGICMTIGLAGFSLATLFGLLILFTFVFGLGIGAVEVGGNDLIVELHSHDRGRYLNLLAVFHGIGSLLVPLYVAALLGLGLSWRQIVQTALVLVLLMLLFFLFVRTIGTDEEAGSNQTRHDGSAIDLHVLRQQGFRPQMLWFYLLIGAYVSVEIGLAAWMVEYLQRIRGVAEAASQYYLSGFFVAIMVGRLAGSFLIERIGYLRSIGGAVLCAAICIGAGLLTENGLLLLPASGLFLSIVFPTVAAAVSARNEENAGSILGLLFTFGGLGGALGPWTIGIVSDRLGLQIGLSCTIVFATLALIALGMLSHTQRNENRSIQS